MQNHGLKPFIYSFIYAVIAAIGFHCLVVKSPSLIDNLQLGLIVGILLVATSFGVNYQFANCGNKLFFIDSGYHAVQFILYAVIFWFIR